MELTHWLRSLASTCKSWSGKSRRRTSRPRNFQHGLAPAATQSERLEDRTLLAVSAHFFPFSNELIIDSTVDDSIAVTVTAGRVKVNALDPSTGPLNASDVQSLRVIGSFGNNTIDLSGMTTAAFPNLQSVLVDAGQGNDVIIGGEFGEQLLGNHGADTIIGGGGDDTINGGDGHDVINAMRVPMGTTPPGGNGGDPVDSDASVIADAMFPFTLRGGEGNDQILGGDGNDTIFGGDGDDSIDGGDGNDLVEAGIGVDCILGGDGADTLFGAAGNDFINGGFGADVLAGNADDDTIFGGADADSLTGGSGNDKLNGQGGNDSLSGGDGNDELIGGTADDILFGGAGNDTLRGDGGNELWHGNDTLVGDLGDDLLDGEGGDDSVLGRDGADTLLGGTGHDTLNGGAGNDLVQGQAGDDQVFGGGGADVLDGGSGHDLVESGGPDDTGLVTVSIDDVLMISEGDGSTTEAVFTVSLSSASDERVLIEFETIADTATAGADFLPVDGVLEFLPGETVKTITVQILGDDLFEGPVDERFLVQIADALNTSRVVDAQGIGTIRDDDLLFITIADTAAAEAGMGMMSQAVFTLSLVDENDQPAMTSVPITVDFATMDDTAVSNIAIPDFIAASGQAVFAAGSTSTTVSVNVVDDAIMEPTETFFLTLSNPDRALFRPQDLVVDPDTMATTNTIQATGTIFDNGDTNIGITIDDLEITEGDMGTSTAAFTVNLSSPATTDVILSVMTMDGTATAPGDYMLMTASPITIPAGMMTGTINVNIVGDLIEEGDETFMVMIGLDVTNTAMNVSVVDDMAIGTILDDDGPLFDIQFRNLTGLTMSQQTALINAATTWEQIITADLPDITVDIDGVPTLIDDISIEVSALTLDGTGGQMGTAGPLALRPDSLLPATGVMEFDSADLLQFESLGILEDFFRHELAHVLGFGTLWTNQDLVGGTGSDLRFLGPQATAEFNALFMGMETGVPIANTTQTVGIDLHWRDAEFGPELMTGTLYVGAQIPVSTVANPISAVTIAQFGDLGYTVDTSLADPSYDPTQTPIVPPMASIPLNVSRTSPAVIGQGPVTPPMISPVLDNGPGDGSVQVEVDGFGSFGRTVGDEHSDAILDLPGDTSTAGTVGSSGVAIRINDSIPEMDSRTFLTSGMIDDLLASTLTNPGVSGDNLAVDSAFGFSLLELELTQTLEMMVDAGGFRNGSILTQIYTINNPSVLPVDFELVRYLDGDLQLNGGMSELNGARRVTTPDGTEILFITEDTVDPDQPTTYVGISALGGVLPATGRFQIDEFSSLAALIQSGMSLTDSVEMDNDSDGAIDDGTEYDVAAALRNIFSLQPGETAIYMTQTFFGFGALDDFTLPAPPIDMEGDTILGGAGNDTLRGGAGDDVIHGQADDDLIEGNAGNDTLRSGAGRDTLFGGTGNDSLAGGSGVDSVFGEEGNDTIAWNVGDGTETVDGGLGFDCYTLESDSRNDRFFIDEDEGRLRVEHRFPNADLHPKFDILHASMVEELTVKTNGGSDLVTVDDLTNVEDLKLIAMDLGGGRDVADASAQVGRQIALSIQGGNGDDTVIGGAGNDTIGAGPIKGADTINGGPSAFNLEAGNDSLDGGGGDDVIDGGIGVDRINGGDGADSLVGGDGRDFIHGQNGDDTIDGGLKNDDLFGGDGNDLIRGGEGHDLILGDDSSLGESGNDTIFGGGGDDTIVGHVGADSIAGDEGNDSIHGGAGNDQINGGLGNDTIEGGSGDDQLYGGDGMFMNLRTMPDGNDFLNGNAGNDTIFGEEGNDSLFGGSGDDELDGGFDNDQLNGNSGNDSLRGGEGSDFMKGATGDDTLNGGHGNDTLWGGAGNDALAGHDNHDVINGGGGADTLHGGDGDDTLRGGAEADILIGADGADDLDGQGGSFDTLVGGQSFDILEDNGGTDLIDNAFLINLDDQQRQSLQQWIDEA